MSTASRPLRLDKAFTEGVAVVVKIPRFVKASPPKGHNWLILSGEWNHITGTISIWQVQKKNDEYRTFQSSIPSANADYTTSIFCNEPTYVHGAFQLIVVSDNEQIYCSGGAGAYISVKVLEWKP